MASTAPKIAVPIYDMAFRHFSPSLPSIFSSRLLCCSCSCMICSVLNAILSTETTSCWMDLLSSSCVSMRCFSDLISCSCPSIFTAISSGVIISSFHLLQYPFHLRPCPDFNHHPLALLQILNDKKAVAPCPSLCNCHVQFYTLTILALSFP